jgi:WD40 repeat protein
MEEGWSLEIRDLDGRFVRMLLENQGEGRWVVFDPTGKTFACRNTNRDFSVDVCEVRDLATGRRIARIPDTASDDRYRYSPDGKTLWAWDTGVFVPVDVATGRLRAGAPYPSGRVHPFQFRADGALVGVAGETVFTWDPRTGRETTRRPKPPSLGWQSGKSFDAAGEHLWCSSSRGVELVWDVSGESVAPPPKLKPPDGEGWMHNEWLQLMRDNGETVIRVLPGDKPDGRPRPGVWRVADEQEFLQAYLAPGGKRLVLVPFHPGWRRTTFSIVDLTDPKSKPVPAVVDHGGGFGLYPEFSPDGRWLAFTGQGERETAAGRATTGLVSVFDLTARRHAAENAVPRLHSYCTFSPDGRTLAVGGHGGAVLLESATWKVRGSVRPPPDMAVGPVGDAVQWSPRGRLFATTTPDGRIAIWDVARLGVPSAGTFEAAWDALAGPDASAAFAALQRLAADPDRALPLFRAKPAPDGLRAVRAVEAVEWMGTPDAVMLLESWAAERSNRRLVEEAVPALARIRNE